MGRLDEEQDNLRAAMGWLLMRSDVETAVRLGWALWQFWWIRGRITEGRRWMEEALAKGVAMPASPRAKALFVAGSMAYGQADSRSAERLLGESVALFRELGDKRGAGYALGSLGMDAIKQEQHGRALTLAAEVGERADVAYCLEGLAAVAGAEGRTVRAARLSGAAEALLEEIGVKSWPHAPDRSLYQRQVAAARAALGEEAFAAAWAEGRAMTAEQAVAYALGETAMLPEEDTGPLTH